MKFKIITQQLEKQLSLDHELKKELVCNIQSFDDIAYIIKKAGPSLIQIFDSTFTPHYKRGSIIPISDHINRTGQNPLIGNNTSKKIEFIDISNLYHCEKKGIITDCCGDKLDKSYIYPSHFLCNFSIVARSLGIEKIQAFLFNIFTKIK